MSVVEKLVLTVPANKRHLGLVGAVVTEICAQLPKLPSTFAYNLQLAIDEAIVNVITHAYQDDPEGRVELTFEIWEDRLITHIQDWGQSFDPSSVPEPDLDHPQDHGYGVYLIRSLSDQVIYEPGPSSNRVTIVKLLPA